MPGPRALLHGVRFGLCLIVAYFKWTLALALSLTLFDTRQQRSLRTKNAFTSGAPLAELVPEPARDPSGTGTLVATAAPGAVSPGGGPPAAPAPATTFRGGVASADAAPTLRPSFAAFSCGGAGVGSISDHGF